MRGAVVIGLESIRAAIIELSGSGKRVAPGARRHGIYSTMTLPGLDDMPAVRDTKQRFDDFGVPKDLNGTTWLDVGCNVGAMAFEAARRGASVTGVEFRQDRVDLCDVIASKWELNALFWQADFNDRREKQVWETQYHSVLCSSVDEYIVDRPGFYSWLNSLCGDTLYFECNVQRDQDVHETIAMLEIAGFIDVNHLGSGHSGGISRKRKIYTARVR